MKIIPLLLSIAFFASQANKENPLTILEGARKKLEANEYIKYRQEAFYPNPVGLIDSVYSLVEFQKNPVTALGFDFRFSQANRAEVNLNDDLKIVDQSVKKVIFFNDQKEIKNYVKRHRNIVFSPLFLLKENWKFVGKNKNHLNFSFTETDTVVDGNTIRTEYHIFLNQQSKLVERFERRNYFKGELSQTVTYKYSDYELNNESSIKSPSLSSDYVSEPFRKATTRTLLKKGSQAPFFNAKDISGEPLDLSSLKGKKTLFVFSTINCGSSLAALDILKSQNLPQKKEISIIFIKPEDTEEELRQFMDIYPIPFPLIPNAEEIGVKYGVVAYPTFYLLDENQIIREVKVGVDRDFLINL